MKDVAPDGVIAAGGEEVYAVGAIAIGHIIKDQIVIGVGEVYSIPPLTPQSVEAGVVSLDDIAVGKKEGNPWLGAPDDGIVGHSAAPNVVQLYAIKPIPDEKAGYADIARFYIHAGVPLSRLDDCPIAYQVQALSYGYLLVSPRSHQEGIARLGGVDCRLQIGADGYGSSAGKGGDQHKRIKKGYRPNGRATYAARRMICIR